MLQNMRNASQHWLGKILMTVVFEDDLDVPDFLK